MNKKKFGGVILHEETRAVLKTIEPSALVVLPVTREIGTPKPAKVSTFEEAMRVAAFEVPIEVESLDGNIETRTYKIQSDEDLLPEQIAKNVHELTVADLMDSVLHALLNYLDKHPDKVVDLLEDQSLKQRLQRLSECREDDAETLIAKLLQTPTHL